MREDKSKPSSECAVCGDKATGIHYRVQSCEGCKGFWRRTIQRNMGTRYTCKLWTETCPITPETRGRCQRCRYLACLKAGMVADLVMADKERLSRLRLVDQNREKRRQEKGLSVGDDKVEQDGKLVELLHTLYGQFLLPTISQEPGLVTRAAATFVETLLFQLMGQRDVRDVVVASHTEIAALHLVTTRPPLDLLSVPLLSELAVQVSSLGLAPTEVVLCMALAATRPRLTWPVSSRQELGMLWDHVAGTVRRSVDSARMAAMLQLVQQVQAVTFYIGPLGMFNSLPPSSMSSTLPLHYPPPPPAPAPPAPAPQHWQSPPHWQAAPLLPPSPYPFMMTPDLLHHSPSPQYSLQERSSSLRPDPSPVLHTPLVKTERLEAEIPFYSPPSELQESYRVAKQEEGEEAVSPTSIPPKKRKLNLYSEILQEAINSTLI